eukprot:tig00000178_g12781.t1
MASSSAASDEGGWPSEIFEPGEEKKAEGLELTCPICCHVMREPTLLGCSKEHALCRKCADDLARGAETAAAAAQQLYGRGRLQPELKCPVDREAISRERFKPAQFISRRINELRVRCRFQARGCKWRGDLASFVNHTKSCPSGRAPCGSCGAVLHIDELPAHEAACRPPCPNAGLGCTAILFARDRQTHLGNCLKELVLRLTRDRDDANRAKEALARDKGALERQVGELREQLRVERRRADEAEAASAELARKRPAIATSPAAAPAASSSQLQPQPRAHQPQPAPVASTVPRGLRVRFVEFCVAPFNSIMDAVRRAAPGQTIRLDAGIYKEQVVLDKEVHIVGSRQAVLLWDNQLDRDVDERSFTVLCKGPFAPSIKGITIANTIQDTRTNMRALWIKDGSRAVIENCDISKTGGRGIEISGEGTAPILRANHVHNCGLSGVYFHSKAKGLLDSCEMQHNGNAGVAIASGADPVVTANWIADQSRGIIVCQGGKGTIERNEFERIRELDYGEYKV